MNKRSDSQTSNVDGNSSPEIENGYSGMNGLAPTRKGRYSPQIASGEPFIRNTSEEHRDSESIMSTRVTQEHQISESANSVPESSPKDSEPVHEEAVDTTQK